MSGAAAIEHLDALTHPHSAHSGEVPGLVAGERQAALHNRIGAVKAIGHRRTGSPPVKFESDGPILPIVRIERDARDRAIARLPTAPFLGKGFAACGSATGS